MPPGLRRAQLSMASHGQRTNADCGPCPTVENLYYGNGITNVYIVRLPAGIPFFPGMKPFHNHVAKSPLNG